MRRRKVTADLWALYLIMRPPNIDLQWPPVAFSVFAPFLDPDIRAGAIQNVPEESPHNILRYADLWELYFAMRYPKCFGVFNWLAGIRISGHCRHRVHFCI